mgnify:CR=1 FL=1
MKPGIHRQGFTLIELLTGMTLLVIMVLFLTRIFNDASSMWRLGNKRVESNFDGRAAVDFMARELSSAINDNLLTLNLFSNRTNLHTGVSADFLAFVTADHNPHTQAGTNGVQRQTKQVIYWLDWMKTAGSTNINNRYMIRRSEVVNQGGNGNLASPVVSFQCYTNRAWYDRTRNPGAWSGSDIIAENVRTMEFVIYDTNGVRHFNYNSVTNGPVGFIDILVELLGEEDSIRIANMPGSQTAQSTAWTNANISARRYFQRVFLNSSYGYVSSP